MTLTESTAYKKNLAELALVNEKIAILGPNLGSLKKKRKEIKERIRSLRNHFCK